MEGVESPECYSALVREYMCVCIKIASFVSGHTFLGRSSRTLWGYFSDVVPTESCLGEVQPFRQYLCIFMCILMAKIKTTHFFFFKR